MSRRLDDHSSETFWPGYVDAVTNLVLNLLFVVVIMTVAVFMFALELGRRQPKQSEETIPAVAPIPDGAHPNPKENIEAEQALRSQLSLLKEQVATLKSKEAQVSALQAKLQNLESKAQQQSQSARQDAKASEAKQETAAKSGSEGTQEAIEAGTSGGLSNEAPKVITATAAIRTPERGLEKAVPAGTMGGIVVKFADDAIALSRPEMDELRKALAPVAAGGGAKIEVVVPTGFSEARRLGFYRAMAVRNQLIELKMPANRIEISVRDGSNSADSSRVLVSPR